MRRVLAPVLALLATAALVPATASAASATDRLIGGTNATSTDVPWQALVLPGPYLCGGAILDATHVVTAAHCVYDEDAGEITVPADITVHAGITDRHVMGQAPAVTGVSVYPSYNPSAQTGDVAVLTLAAPGFTFGSTVKAIALTAVGYRPAPTDDLTLSGWGSNVPRSPYDTTTVPHAVDNLQVATTLHTNAGCATVYAPFPDDLLLCAGEENLDACQGDSGGPLAVTISGTPALAGIVTGGAGCAWAGFPGYYARVANQGINDFLAQRGVGYAVEDPVNVTPPSITGAAKPGGTLTCDLGHWDHAYAYGVGFATATGGLFTTGSRSIVVSAALAGQDVTCVVAAWGLTGTAQAESAPVTIAGNAPPAATPDLPPPADPPAPPPLDATAPTAKVTKVRCTRKLCLLDVHAEDPAPSSGIRSVEGRVTTAYRTTCVKKHKRRACTKTVTQKLKAVVIGPGVYRLTTPKLRKGKHTFSLIATDANGNRQAKATTLTRTTR
ncbi:MAG TPA: serine protease [Baekduia sp.]|nr:serine protease [Baekduia sp.]